MHTLCVLIFAHLNFCAVILDNIAYLISAQKNIGKSHKIGDISLFCSYSYEGVNILQIELLFPII